MSAWDVRPTPARSRGTEFWCARHIRGRVFLARRPDGYRRALYGMEVVNTRTGKVLASDNCTVWQKVIDECQDATRIARGAYFWSLTAKGLKA